MKKFLGKKSDSGSNRDALFGSSKSNQASTNPYADAPANDPYTSGNGGGNPPPPYSSGHPSSTDNYRPDKSGVPPSGYGVPAGGDRLGNGGGYGNQQDRHGGPPPAGNDNRGPPENRFGGSSVGYGGGSYSNTGGFGQDRYGGPPQQQQQPQAASRYGSAGYGGFGSSGPAQPNTVARDALFAHSRPQAPPGGPGAPAGSGVPDAAGQSVSPVSDWESGRGPGYGSASPYEPYGNRQLTAEEMENEEIEGARQQIRFIKQQDVSSTRNALR
jgi:protein transport protein SEC9